MRAERVTIADVAARAGVSSMTVSNVINNRPGASEATRRRVLGVVEELGYQGAAGRGARTGRTGRTGLICLDLTSEYAHEILRGVAEVLADEERELLVNVSVDAIRERERIQFLARDITDGLLLVAPALEEGTVDLLRSLRIPVVVIDPRQREVPLPRVTVDNYEGVRRAVEHLLALGHRRIAYVRGEEDHDSTWARYRGFEDALGLAGIPVEEDLVEGSSFSFAGGVQAADALLERARPTAVVAGADLIALGVVAAARARGLDVPGDLSVVGFDDLPQSAGSTPPLTTVRQPLAEMGRVATRALLALVEGQALPVEHLRLETELVLRETTARPPR